MNRHEAIRQLTMLARGNPDAEKALERLLQDVAASIAEQPAAVPEGWMLVPVEPTEEMKAAALGMSCFVQNGPWVETLWQRMLAAASSGRLSPAKPAAVPDEDNSNWSGGDHYDDGYANGVINGWNACRAEMLRRLAAREGQ